MDQPVTILIPNRGRGFVKCRTQYDGDGMVCGLDQGHTNDYHMAFGIDGKVPLLLWLTDEADERRRSTPPRYEPPTIYPRLDTPETEIEQWIR